MSADPMTMTLDQCLVLDRMTYAYGYPMADVAADTGVPVKEVSRIVRRFHELDIADLHPFFDEDSGKICGRGYSLSSKGHDAQKLIRRMMGPALFHEQMRRHEQRKAAPSPVSRNGGVGL